MRLMECSSFYPFPSNRTVWLELFVPSNAREAIERRLLFILETYGVTACSEPLAVQAPREPRSLFGALSVVFSNTKKK